MKTKKERPIVTAIWRYVSDPEYDLEIKCPNKKCARVFYQDELYGKDYEDIEEGEKIDRIIMCPHCETKFRLRAKAV